GGSLNVNPKGPKRLVPSLWLAVPVDIVRGALGIYIGQATTGVMRNYMQQMFQAASAGKPLPPIGDKIVGVSLLFSEMALGMMVVWVACKTGYYIASAMYLRRADSQRLFDKLPQ